MSLPLLVDNHMEASSLLYKYSVAFVILNYGFIIADLSGAVNHHLLKNNFIFNKSLFVWLCQVNKEALILGY